MQSVIQIKCTGMEDMKEEETVRTNVKSKDSDETNTKSSSFDTFSFKEGASFVEIVDIINEDKEFKLSNFKNVAIDSKSKISKKS